MEEKLEVKFNRSHFPGHRASDIWGFSFNTGTEESWTNQDKLSLYIVNLNQQFKHNFLPFFLLWDSLVLFNGSVFQTAKLVSCHEFHWFTCFTLKEIWFTLSFLNCILPSHKASENVAVRSCTLEPRAKFLISWWKEVICNIQLNRNKSHYHMLFHLKMKYLCCHKATAYQ